MVATERCLVACTVHVQWQSRRPDANRYHSQTSAAIFVREVELYIAYIARMDVAARLPVAAEQQVFLSRLPARADSDEAIR